MYRILHGSGGAEATPARQRVRGFTIIEMLSVVIIMGILAGLALPPLHDSLERARVARAIGDVKAIQVDLMSIEAGEQPLPADLAAIGRGGMLDPWGQPYVYYPFPPNDKKPPGARKDKFLKPVNSTFDLYSMGADGKTQLSFNAKASLDDIVRAIDGGFVGLAKNF